MPTKAVDSRPSVLTWTFPMREQVFDLLWEVSPQKQAWRPQGASQEPTWDPRVSGCSQQGILQVDFGEDCPGGSL